MNFVLGLSIGLCVGFIGILVLFAGFCLVIWTHQKIQDRVRKAKENQDV